MSFGVFVVGHTEQSQHDEIDPLENAHQSPALEITDQYS